MGLLNLQEGGGGVHGMGKWVIWGSYVETRAVYDQIKQGRIRLFGVCGSRLHQEHLIHTGVL